MWTANGRPAAGELATPGSYARIVRVLELSEHREWYDDSVARANTPFGAISESTRPMDVLLLAGAAAGAPLVGFERALAVWAVAVGPFLHVVTLLALMWAIEPMLGHRTIWAGVLFPFQLLLSRQFAAGQADHHALLLLLLVWLTGAAIRALRPGTGLGQAALAGLAASLAAWTALEGLAGAAIVSIGFALVWLSGGIDVARQGYMYTAVVSIGLFAATALERPPALLLEPGYHSVSAAHAFAFSVTAGAWLACGVLGSWAANRAWKRTLVVTLATIAAASCAFQNFPDLFTAAPVPVGAAGADLWIEDLSPRRALIDANVPLVRATSLLLMHLGPLLLVLPYVRQAPRRAREHDRRCWLLLAWALAVAVPLAVRDLQWAPLAQLFILIPYAGMAGAMVERLRPRSPVLRGALAATAGILFVCLFPAGGAQLAAAAPSLAGEPQPTAPPRAAAPVCDLEALAARLDALWPKPQRVLTFVGYGPELLYRSRHEVVGTTSMANVTAILDTIDFFSTDDLSIAREVVRRRGIHVVVACASDREAAGYRTLGVAPSTLELLVSGRQPAWLDKLSGRSLDAPGFVAFRVLG